MTAILAAGAGGVAAANDTGKAEIVLSEMEGGKTDFDAIKSIQSIVTDSEIAATYLRDYNVFDRVVVTSTEPLTNEKAASVARANGVDGYLFSNPGGPSNKSGMLLKTVVYGTITIAIVDRQGNEVYKQRIALQRGELFAKELQEREVVNALGVAAVKDIQFAQGKSAPVKSQVADSSK
jgi:hypothetical protein